MQRASTRLPHSSMALGSSRCQSESKIWTSCSDTRPAHAHNTSWSNIDRTYTQPGLLRSFVPLYVAGSQLCLQKALYFMSLTPPPKAKLSNKAPLQGPLGPCLPPRSSGSSVVGLEVSSGAQNPIVAFILKQPSNSSPRPRSFSRTIPGRTPQSASRTEEFKTWMSRGLVADPRSYPGDPPSLAYSRWSSLHRFLLLLHFPHP